MAVGCKAEGWSRSRRTQRQTAKPWETGQDCSRPGSGKGNSSRCPWGRRTVTDTIHLPCCNGDTAFLPQAGLPKSQPCYFRLRLYMSNKCREPGPGQLNWYHHGFNSKLLRASASPELAFVISTWTEPSVGGAVLVQKRGSVCPGLKVWQVRLLLEGASQCGAPAPGIRVSAGRAGRGHGCCRHPRGTGGMGDLLDSAGCVLQRWMGKENTGNLTHQLGDAY